MSTASEARPLESHVDEDSRLRVGPWLGLEREKRDEQLELVGRIGRAPKVQTRHRARELLDEVGLGTKAMRRTAHLSGGERQRVGIARALMAAPPVLLVDEPTSALDHQRGIDIVTLLRDETRRHQIATLMVTHDLSAAHLADRLIEMRDGRLTPAASATAH